MRTASFLFISAALHAAALAYPAFYNAPDRTPPVVVSLVEDEGGGGGGDNSAPAEKAGGASVPALKTQKQMKRAPAQNALPPRAVESAALAETPKTAEPVAIAAPAEPVALLPVETQAQSAIAIPVRESAVTVALESGAALSRSTAQIGSSHGGSDSTAAAGARGSGSGSGAGAGSGSGGGFGSGQGNGSGDGSGDARFVQASYAQCPRADYPEAARRNGQEGKVTVLVLVGADGRPKSSQVLISSGVASLDRAAVDNVQLRCRFHPAKRGDQRVETSIKVPVEFRLADNR